MKKVTFTFRISKEIPTLSKLEEMGIMKKSYKSYWSKTKGLSFWLGTKDEIKRMAAK